jgi:hypothetical protein
MLWGPIRTRGNLTGSVALKSTDRNNGGGNDMGSRRQDYGFCRSCEPEYVGRINEESLNDLQSIRVPLIAALIGLSVVGPGHRQRGRTGRPHFRATVRPDWLVAVPT